MWNDPGRQTFTYDAELVLAEEGTTSAASPVVGQVDGSDQILDIGSGRVNGHLVLDVSDANIADSDEKYRFELRLSNSSTHASGIVTCAILEIGDNTQLSGDVDLQAARYVIPFTNVIGNEVYQYAQIRLVPTGTTVSVTWSAWVNKNPF